MSESTQRKHNPARAQSLPHGQRGRFDGGVEPVGWITDSDRYHDEFSLERSKRCRRGGVSSGCGNDRTGLPEKPRLHRPVKPERVLLPDDIVVPMDDEFRARARDSDGEIRHRIRQVDVDRVVSISYVVQMPNHRGCHRSREHASNSRRTDYYFPCASNLANGLRFDIRAKHVGLNSTPIQTADQFMGHGLDSSSYRRIEFCNMENLHGFGSALLIMTADLFSIHHRPTVVDSFTTTQLGFCFSIRQRLVHCPRSPCQPAI